VRVLVRVNVPARDCSTTDGLLTHVPTSPLTNTRAENSCLLALFRSYVERARVHVFGYVHVHEQVHVNGPISSKGTH
jgi:hypothetical protein